MAPTASPGFLGIVTELYSKFLSADTPKMVKMDLKTKGLVS